MTAIVMTCTSAEKHPNADSLRLYTFSYGDNNYKIIANMENVYEVGDNAEIVLANSILKSGEKIAVSNLRGVSSQGMALGKTDLSAGTDVTEKHCIIQNGFVFKGWISIELLSNVAKYLYDSGAIRKLKYKAKIKLHGTNAGIQIKANGQDICVQSRNRIITPEDDNLGFANWVNENKDLFKIKSEFDLTIYGEWCGPGIMKGTSISQIKDKIFAVFAVQVDKPGSCVVYTDPDKIRTIINDVDGKIYILPWMYETELDFTNKTELELNIENLNKIVADIGITDPWVKDTFGIDGIGEGIVMYPVLNEFGTVNLEDLNELIFKVKDKAHQVIAAKKPAQLEPEKANSITEFVNLFVTENRLEQIAQTIGDFDKKNTGAFVIALVNDVQKESEEELKISGLDWKDVSKAVSNSASKWWIFKSNIIKVGE